MNNHRIIPIACAAVAWAVVAEATTDLERLDRSAREVGVLPREHPDWSRPPAHVPAALADATLPEHYVNRGQAVLMPVEGSLFVVQLADDAGDARGVVDAAGLAVSGSDALGFGGWHAVRLTEPLPTGAAVREALVAVSDRPEVAFASPAFVNPDIAGGWLAVTTDVFARVQPNHLAAAAAVLQDAAPELAIVETDVAGLPGTFRLRGNPVDGFDVLSVANRLALDPRFAWAEPEFIGTMQLVDVIPDDPGFEMCWGLQNTGQQGCCEGIDLNAPAAWDIANGNFEFRVLVMDVGVDQDHEDISQVAGSDFTDGSANGFGDGDPLGVCDRHGTAVAGIIASTMNNGIGTVGIAGGSWIVSARTAVEQSNPCSSNYAFYMSAFVANAINWGYTNDILITNASFNVGTSMLIEDAYADTWFNGMMHFAGAGNDGDNSINFPANLPTVHAVGSIDADGDLSSFSDSGPGIGFVAPGNTIWTTDRTGDPGYNDGEYVFLIGTSAACPFVAGAAALVWSALPDYSSIAIEFWLQNQATGLGPAGYDTTYGWGMPNPRASLNGPGPLNNFCANAWPILSPIFDPPPFDTTQATAFDDEPQEWCEVGNVGVSNSVWFAFYSPCDAVVDIDTNGSDYDTVISLWAGLCTFAFPIECDDDSGAGLASLLEGVPVAGDTLYMIKVSDYNTTPGGGQLELNFVYRQPNDDCPDAIEIDAGTTEFCTLGASNSIFQPNCGGADDTLYGDVWFRHTATQDGPLTIAACGLDGFDTKLAVYEEFNGTSCPFVIGAQLIACNDDSPEACSGVSSSVTVDVEAGLEYTIRVGGHDGPTGTGPLNLVYGEPCSGDVTGDGSVDVNDLVEIILAWGVCGGDCPADVTGDGTVDVNDLVEVILAWGSCL
ncbi:MAG: S8 family serine peptidase [Planctomycetota bacterium]|jgi:thermitase